MSIDTNHGSANFALAARINHQQRVLHLIHR
jgi:hypothetical protein